MGLRRPWATCVPTRLDCAIRPPSPRRDARGRAGPYPGLYTTTTPTNLHTHSEDARHYSSRRPALAAKSAVSCVSALMPPDFRGFEHCRCTCHCHNQTPQAWSQEHCGCSRLLALPPAVALLLRAHRFQKTCKNCHPGRLCPGPPQSHRTRPTTPRLHLVLDLGQSSGRHRRRPHGCIPSTYSLLSWYTSPYRHCCRRSSHRCPHLPGHRTWTCMCHRHPHLRPRRWTACSQPLPGCSPTRRRSRWFLLLPRPLRCHHGRQRPSA